MKEFAFLNVMADGTVYADGVHDDTAALQRCLDRLREGGTLYFPDGVYLLSAALIFYSNQRLMFSENAVLLRDANSQPVTKYMLASYSDPETPGYEGTHDVVISGGVFDGGASEECLTIINTVHCRNVEIRSCRFRHGAHWHFIEINGTCNARISGCVFDGTSYTVFRPNLTSELIQLDASRIGAYGPVFDCHGEEIKFCSDATPCREIVIEDCIFKCGGFPGIGHHGNDEHAEITIRGNVFDGAPGLHGASRGYITFLKQVHGVLVRENAFLSTMEKDETAHAIVMENPNENACIAENNVLCGSYTRPFVGGVTERSNTFR